MILNVIVNWISVVLLAKIWKTFALLSLCNFGFTGHKLFSEVYLHKHEGRASKLNCSVFIRVAVFKWRDERKKAIFETVFVLEVMDVAEAAVMNDFGVFTCDSAPQRHSIWIILSTSFFPPRLVTVVTRVCCFNCEPTLLMRNITSSVVLLFPLLKRYLTSTEHKTSLLWRLARLWMLYSPLYSHLCFCIVCLSTSYLVFCFVFLFMQKAPTFTTSLLHVGLPCCDKMTQTAESWMKKILITQNRQFLADFLAFWHRHWWTPALMRLISFFQLKIFFLNIFFYN